MGESELFILKYHKEEFCFSWNDDYEVVNQNDDIIEIILMENLKQRFFSYLLIEDLIQNDNANDFTISITFYLKYDTAVVEFILYQNDDIIKEVLLPAFSFRITK